MAELRRVAISLPHLQKTDVLSIFSKLNNLELCRMRRTCSFVDSFVEDHKSTLSKRNITGEVTVDLCAEELATKEKSTMLRELSAIAISDIHIVFRENDDLNLLFKMKDILSALKPVCDSLHLKMVPLLLLESIMNLVECRKYVEIFHVGSNFTAFLPTLNKFRQRNMFHVNVVPSPTAVARMPVPYDQVFENIKHFLLLRDAKIYLNSAKNFNKLLWEMYRSPTSGNIRELHFFLTLSKEEKSYGFPYVKRNNPSPPFRKIFKKKHFLKAFKFAVDINQIHLLDIADKTAVIIEEEETAEGVTSQHIIFLPQDERIVRQMVLNRFECGFTKRYFERYHSLSMEDQERMLRRSLKYVAILNNRIDHFARPRRRRWNRENA